jgi:hypothetical protein
LIQDEVKAYNPFYIEANINDLNGLSVSSLNKPLKFSISSNPVVLTISRILYFILLVFSFAYFVLKIDFFKQTVSYKNGFIAIREKNETISSASKNSELTSTVVESFTDDAGRLCSKIGSLIVTDSLLGYGSQGTVVFKGSLNGREVAVKRMLSQFNSAAERSIVYLNRKNLFNAY